MCASRTASSLARSRPPRRAAAARRYSLPSSIFSTWANAFGSPAQKKNAALLWKVVWRARQIVETFRPFTESSWLFMAPSHDVMRARLAPADMCARERAADFCACAGARM